MDENPPRSWKVADFREPRLRRCNLDLDSVDWEHANVVGAGMDGFVWRVYFGDKGPYALKLFWDPDPHDVKQAGSFAAQRECQNAALLKMIRASVDQATAEGSKTPVLVLADPSTLEDAKANFFGFAEEVRRTRMREHFGTHRPNLVEVAEMPRFAKCYGWLHFNRREVFPRMPRRVLPHSIRVGKHLRSLPPERDTFIAIVYEYIEEGENNVEAVEKVAKFLWLAGFSFSQQPLAKNWKSGVLIDHSDIVGPGFYGWQKHFYSRLSAKSILAE
ncbi:hypothetical protein GE09DRAFT_577346 [Coniochaeta sp. 2T2.1]|nr:hypothetical protein GE09DRAFT_577346 [Coniochaeta sp. 2T2.1]